MTDIKNILKEQDANKPKKQERNMNALLNSMAKQIKMALPKEMDSDRYKRIVLTAFNNNKQLQQCDPTSFLAAMMQSAQLGLEPNTALGQAYLIPYKTTVQFQIGYQGLLTLAYRSGLYKSITAREVCENDTFELDYGTETIKHIPNLKDERGTVYGYYAKYETITGARGIYYLSKKEAEKYGRKYSKTYAKGPWQTDFDSMAKKTALKQLLKYAPKAIDDKTTNLETASNIDNSIIKDYKADDQTIEFDYEYTPEELEE